MSTIKRPRRGRGFISNAINKVREWIVPKTLSSKFKSILAKYGNQKITKVVIGREPVIGMVQKVVNWISGGEYEKKRKELNYDQVFHLYMLLTLQDGTTLKIEKNAIPQITVNPSKPPKESISVASPGNTLAEFIGKTVQRLGEKDYVRYDASSLNCQHFIQNHLQANGISTPEATKFIMQEADKLLTGKTRSIAKAITDIAATATQAVGGRRKRPKKIRSGRGTSIMRHKLAVIKQKGKGLGLVRSNVKELEATLKDVIKNVATTAKGIADQATTEEKKAIGSLVTRLLKKK